ncbi:MAG: type VI secretion system protein TssA [Pseudomonadota bacterium]
MARQKTKSATSPQYQEITQLICPIPGGNLVGPYIRYGSLFDSIVTARTQEDATLPQGIWKREIKQANWPEVVTLCKDFLEHHSKDLQIAAWLMQAWYHTKALEGLTQGLSLFNQLCTNYWQQIHPHRMDAEENLEERCNLIYWLNEKLPPDLHQLQMTKPANPKVAIFTFADTLRFASSPKPAMNKAIATAFQQSQAETPASFYNTIISDTTTALDELKNLEHTLDTHIGGNLFSLSQLRQTLEAIQHFAKEQCKKYAEAKKMAKQVAKKQPPTPLKQKTITKPAAKAPEKADPALAKNSSNDCQQIYRQLEEIITNLKQIHPQSPAAYLIQKAITLDQKSLQEWLEDINQHNLDIQSVQKWLGILPQERK